VSTRGIKRSAALSVWTLSPIAGALIADGSIRAAGAAKLSLLDLAWILPRRAIHALVIIVTRASAGGEHIHQHQRHGDQQQSDEVFHGG